MAKLQTACVILPCEDWPTWNSSSALHLYKHGIKNVSLLYLQHQKREAQLPRWKHPKSCPPLLRNCAKSKASSLGHRWTENPTFTIIFRSERFPYLPASFSRNWQSICEVTLSINSKVATAKCFAPSCSWVPQAIKILFFTTSLSSRKVVQITRTYVCKVSKDLIIR